jgi:hypothetical protein
MLIGMKTVKSVLMRHQMGIRNLLGTGLETICVTFCKEHVYIFSHPKTLCVAEFKYDGLVYLVEETSRQYSIQAVAWIWLTFKNQIYSENWKQKAEGKDLKKLSGHPENKCVYN